MPITKYALPDIIFGPGTFVRMPLCARQLGAQRVLLISDPGLERAGWVEQAMDLLRGDGLEWIYYNECVPNPRDEALARGAEVYREERADVIVALGGGSPMDTAKGIAALVGNGGRIQDYEGANKLRRPLPPLLCVPTTAGSGSDISQFCIITDRRRKLKMSIISRTLTPNISIVDPLLPRTGDARLLIASAIDALAHAVESYLSTLASPFTVGQALESISRIVRFLPAAVEDGTPEALEQLCIASTQAGMSFSNAGLGVGHALAHALGGAYDVTHGAVHPVFLPLVMEYNMGSCPEKVASIGGCILGRRPRDTEAAARGGIRYLRRFFARWGVPVRLSQILPDDAGLAAIAAGALQDVCTLTNPRTPTQEELLALCREAW